MKQRFSQLIISWYLTTNRDLPWKGIKDPYLIWLSEVILQQTRVEQGLPYFQRFKNAFPDVEALARAPEDEVMKLWEGLGYYSRARNMMETAKFIAFERKGQFPDTFEELLRLKGIGHYTAAAIASFAFDLPHAVVDGNVYRVLSRYFGISDPIDNHQTKKVFAKLAQELIDTKQPGVYNQAIMDFGATHCKPKQPLCSTCPAGEDCFAKKHDKAAVLPVKQKKIRHKTRYFNYFILKIDGKTCIRKREHKDIWRNLYEFPMLETPAERTTDQGFTDVEMTALFGTSNISVKQVSRPYKQTLTHQKIIARFWEVSDHEDVNSDPWLLVNPENLSKFAFPKIIDCYFKDKLLYLNF